MPFLSKGQIWRHKKRGDDYQIVETDAAIQCSTDAAVEAYECRPWVAYRNMKTGKLVFRLTDEFLDGRFELTAY